MACRTNFPVDFVFGDYRHAYYLLEVDRFDVIIVLGLGSREVYANGSVLSNCHFY